MKKSLTYAFILIGTFVGVGFISGREIVTFFSRFGVVSILTSLISVGLIVFNMVVENKISAVNNQKLATNKLFKVNEKLLKVLFYLCNFIVLISMIAGVHSLCFTLFDNIIGAMVAGAVILVCYALVIRGLDSLKRINIIFVPIAIMLVSVIFINKLGDGRIVTSEIGNNNIILAILFSILYSGMNSLTILPVVKLVPKGNKTIGIFFILSALLITIINLILLTNQVGDMPLLNEANLIGNIFSKLFSVILLMGLMTTLLSSAFVLKKAIDKNGNQNFESASLIFFIAIIVSILGFKNIINFLYPAIGALGAIVFIIRFIYFAQFKNCKNNKNTI
ncbi:MAG: hypothetical protein J5689_03435 [Clostridia bacterium]|nr:hypothetical protein [Clostridia bacterium]